MVRKSLFLTIWERQKHMKEEILAITKRLVAIPSVNTTEGEKQIGLFLEEYLREMPSGSLNVVMAQKYKNNPEFAATTIMQNTILMIVTLPIFTYLCEVWLF